MLKSRIFSIILSATLLMGLIVAFPASADGTETFIKDFQDKNIGDEIHKATGNDPAEITVQADPGDSENMVARIEYTAGKQSSWGPTFNVPNPTSASKLAYEVRLRFDGNDPGVRFTLYLRTQSDNRRETIWRLFGPNNTNNSDWAGGIQLYVPDGTSGNMNQYWSGDAKKGIEGVIKEGVWYRIVTEINTANNQYVVNVCDDDYNVLKSSKDDIVPPNNVRTTYYLEDFSQGIKSFELRYGGEHVEGQTNNYVYFDDIKIKNLSSPYDDALAAVIMAETTKTKADMEAAITLVNALDDGEEKTSLLNRLDAIDVVWVDIPIFYTNSIAPENIIDTLTEGKIIATVDIESNNIDPQQTTLVAALYKKADDGNSVLVKCSFSEPRDVDGTTPIRLDASLDVNNIDDGEYFIKAFVWDNSTTLTPLLSTPKILPAQ